MLHNLHPTPRHNTRHSTFFPTSRQIVSIHPTAPSSSPNSPEPTDTLPNLELIPPQLSALSCPILHLACTQSYIATASTALLSVWRLNPAYSSPLSPNQVSPFCHLQSQWPCPHDFRITALALSPDESVLALSLQHEDSAIAGENVAIALLHPYTCVLLARIALPNSLQFAPNLSTARACNQSLCFVSCSPFGQHRKPFKPMFDVDDLPPHLHDVFRHYGGSQPLPSNLKPSPQLAGSLAPFALAVCGTNGVAALYRFLSTYQQVFDFTRIDSSSFFRVETAMTMSPIVHLQLAHLSQSHEVESRVQDGDADSITHFLGFCSSRGAVLMYDGTPVLKIPSDRFRPLAVCAARRDSNRVSHAVVLASWPTKDQFDSAFVQQAPSRKRHRAEQREHLCFVVWTPGKPCEVLSVDSVGVEEFRDIAILRESNAALSVLISSVRGFVAGYRISLRTENSFQISPYNLCDEMRGLIAQNEAGSNTMMIRKGSYIIAVIASQKSTLVQAVPYPLTISSLSKVTNEG